MRRRGGGVDPLRHLVMPVIGALVLLAVLVSASAIALIVGGLWAVIGLVILLGRGVGRRREPA